MSCTGNDFYVLGKNNGALYQSVKYVGDNNLTKCGIIASFFEDPKFNTFLKEYIGEESPETANQNTVRAAMRKWYNLTHRRVDNTSTKVNGDILNGFSNAKAKSLALNNTADILLRLTAENNSKPKNKRKNNEDLLNDVINVVRDNFYVNYALPAYHKFKQEGGASIAELEEILAKSSEYRKWLSDVYNKHGKNIPKDLRAEFKEKSAYLKSIDNRKFVLLNNFVSKHGSIQEKNFANYTSQLFVPTTRKEWFNQALSLKKTIAIAKKYGTSLTGEDLAYYFVEQENELDENEAVSDGLNEESRRYIDDIDKYKSFLQLVGDDIRQYISSLRNLNKIWSGKKEEALDYNKDNELGVTTSMNAGFVINNIISRCDFASGVEGFIKSIENLMNGKKELYGLSVLVHRMKTDPVFARKLFHELANPVVVKTMIQLEELNPTIVRSNRAADPALTLLFTMTNQAKSTIYNAYDTGAKDILNSVKNRLVRFKDTNIAEKAIKQYLLKYFPGIELQTIQGYIDANAENKQAVLINMLNKLIEFNTAVESVVEELNNKKYADVNFDQLVPSISDIVKDILPYTVVPTELNSVNAEGNMSSDSIANNNITNLINQIKYGNEENINAGLERLKDVITKCRQYDNSPIFYGVYDGDTELIPGLFKRIGNSVVINDKAKHILRSSLFNGISSDIDNEGALYANMSKADYFVSSLIAYHKKYVDNNNINLGFEDAGYFLRVPSDAPKNFIIHAPKVNTNGLFVNGAVNRNHTIYRAYKQVFIGEINNLIRNLNNVFEKTDKGWVVKKNADGLFSIYHHKNGTIFKDGKLQGRVFNLIKLHGTDNFNAEQTALDMLSLYGGEQAAVINKDGSLNLERTDIIKEDENGAIVPNISLELEANIENFIDNWLNAVAENAINEAKQYEAIIDNKFSNADIIDMVLNTNLMYNNFDDLFEGDSKFYKDAQTFLKRAKEVQAGGKAYDNWSVSDEVNGKIKVTEDHKGNPVSYTVAGREVYARNGFRAITIANTIRPSVEANQLKAKLIENGVNSKIAKDIASRFGLDQEIGNGTTVNDAQSYITIEEFANRCFADGSLNQYKPILDKLLAKDENGNHVPLSEEDYKNLIELGDYIQVQKNFYYDKQYDANTGTMYPRQIKNAECVLIPQLLPEDSSLRELYDIMVKYDLGQVNTAETDKAAKRYILEFWDNNGKVTDKAKKKLIDQLETKDVVEDYYYRFLYKQQQVAQHMENEQNKAGIQIMKKIIDNAMNYSTNVQNAVNKLFTNYVANIEESYNEMMDNMGWKVNESGQVVNKDDGTLLNFEEFYKRGREEAKRVGMDSNFLAYFDTDENGHAILPNFMNTVQSKLESIAQAMFNSAITRQKLPGWHAAQVTNVGYNSELGYHKNGSTFAEIRLTPWFASKVGGKEVTLEELMEAGLNKMIIYRIPTEGKQSISIAEVTDLLNPIEGSKVVLPDEWITQTGSDFDVDSVYGIQYKFKRNKETGKLEKITEGRDGRNNAILDAMIEIMSDPSVLEENLSCSNFDDISDNIKYFNDVNPLINASSKSVYNIFDQMIFFENATSGMALKAQSVIRDNFDSINSYVRSELNPNNAIKIAYDLNEYNIDDINNAYDDVDTKSKPGYAIVTHNRLANSKNNRNVLGKLITVYSSQTTAHILDAIKTGAIFNENLYTFGSFKTLIDFGIDYKTAISFLQQPAITEIVNNYNRNKSIYSDVNNYDSKPINDAIRNIAIKLGGKFTEYSTLDSIQSFLQSNKKLNNAFKKLFGAELSFSKDQLYNFITLEQKELETRLKQGIISNISENNNTDQNYETIAYDLGITLFFKQLYNTTKGLENIAKVSNPDKFGAKQTVATTRAKLQTIKDIINKKGTLGYGLLTINSESFLEALYPGVLNENINVEKAAYPYLAAFLKYSTIPSININSQLFALESPEINDMAQKVQEQMGHIFNENKQREWKEYLVSIIYNNVNKLVLPVTVDEKGDFVIDTVREKQYHDTANAEYWNIERARIKGYYVTESSDFDVADITQVTTEEIIKFNKLTPVQKINAIKKLFNEDAGIFSYITTNIYKGENIIKYKDVTDDIENLYKLIDDAFFNKHPLVRLATLDLMKYAFIVEGGKFKKGNISKLITKNMMLASNDNYGINFVNTLNVSFKNLIDNKGLLQDQLLDRFVRSHSSMVKSVKLKNGNPISKYQKKEIYIIPDTDKEATNYIKYHNNAARKYIRLEYANTEDNTKITRLYQITKVGGRIILTPLNLLDANETTEYSTNSKNNVFKTSDYYRGVINYELGLHDDNLLNKSFSELAEYRIKQLVKHAPLVNENTLSELNESTNKSIKQEIDRIMTDITDLIRYPVDRTNIGIIASNSNILRNLIPGGQAVRQQLTIDSKPYILAFYKVNNKRFTNILSTPEENIRREDIDRLSPAERNIYDKVRSRGLNKPYLYGVSIISQEQLTQENTTETNEETNFASSRAFFDTDTNNIVYTDFTDTIGEKIINEVIRTEQKYPTTLTNEFIDSLRKNNINFNSIENIHKNIGTLLGIGANYYTKRGNELLRLASKFTLADAREFNISDPNLYTALEEQEDVDALIKLLLDLKTFGNTIKDIINLESNSEDVAVQTAINNIKAIINKVANNSNINKAFENIFNIYFAKYSTNPAIQNGILALRDAFGDISTNDLLVSAITELNNNQIQIMTKYINNRLKNVQRTTIPKAVESFEKRYDEIMAEDGPFNINNIVTKEGYLIRDYTPEFFEKRNEWAAKVKEAEEKYTKNDIRYYKIKLEYDKWLTKNVHRRIKADYYNQLNRLTEDVLNNASDLYNQYNILQEQLYELNVSDEFDTNENILRKKEILYRIGLLSSIYNEDMTEKSRSEQNKTKALAKYIKNKAKLNSLVFKQTATDEFNEQFEYHKNIIEEYDNKHPNKTLDQKLNDDTYANSYNWIQTNTIKQLNATTKRQLDTAFVILKADSSEMPNYVKNILRGKDVYDENGRIDPSKIDIETARQIKEAKEKQFDANDSVARLIKNVPANKPIFTKEWFDNINDQNADGSYNELVFEINSILKKVITNGEELNTSNLFNKLSKEELNELSSLYFELQNPVHTSGEINPIVTFIEHNSTRVYNLEAFREELNYFLTNIKGTRNESVWMNIFVGRDKYGNYKTITDPLTNEEIPCPNPQIFGYRIPTEEYRDRAKENARKLINDNVQWNTTEAYDRAVDEAYLADKYEEWYHANHYYNPITGEYVPLPYWTTMEINPNGTLDATYEQVPTKRNTKKEINSDYINDKYNRNSKINYNTETGQYNNNVNLSSKEKHMRDLFQEVLDNSASNSSMRKLAEQGFMPRKAKTVTDAKWAATQAFGAFGVTIGYRQPEWTHDIEYETEIDPEHPMSSLLKQKGYKEIKPKPQFVPGMSQETYNTMVEDWKKESEEIRAHNIKLDNEILDRDWKNVLKDYIQESILYNEKRTLANTAHLLMQDLRSNQAIKMNWLGNPSKKAKRTADSGEEYNTEKFDNLNKLVENWYHRVFRDEFKVKNKNNALGSLMQNLTSAKYMIFNITGGIANLATGTVNTLGESLAKEYISNADWKKAAAEYGHNVINIIANQYSDTATSLTDALIKAGNVVDIDAIIERNGNSNIHEYAKRVRDKMYVLQSGGEHIMQNTIFLAMLHSHRIYRDPRTQKYTFGNFEEFIRKEEENIFKSIIHNNTELLQFYDNFIKKIEFDQKLKYEYGTYKRNIINDFIKEFGDRSLQEKYNDAREKARKDAEIRFKENPTIYSQFELKNGKAVYKAGSIITDEIFNGIINRTISVNQRIHGVYDKIGAAYIERWWWGTLLMQYHKHIYPGFMKRYRKNAMFNESRGTIEKGYYWSLWDLTSKSYKDAIEANKDMDNVVMRSIYNIVEGSYKLITDIKFNYKSMPDWEKANVRRALAEHLGVLSAIMMAILLHAGFDDDDFKENNFLATALYQTDRLATESFELHPLGLKSTFKTTWSSPVASINGPQDLLESTDILWNMCFNDEYEWEYTTGRYKGRNKLLTKIGRNVPIYRIYDRLSGMGQSNKYYRIGNSTLSIVPTKTIGNAIQGEK